MDLKQTMVFSFEFLWILLCRGLAIVLLIVKGCKVTSIYFGLWCVFASLAIMRHVLSEFSEQEFLTRLILSENGSKKKYLRIHSAHL